MEAVKNELMPRPDMKFVGCDFHWSWQTKLVRRVNAVVDGRVTGARMRATIRRMLALMRIAVVR